MIEDLITNLDQDVPLNSNTLLTRLDNEMQQIASEFEFRMPVNEQDAIRSKLPWEIDLCAKALIASGVDAGNKIGVYDATVKEWIVLFGATQKIGAKLVSVGREFSSDETHKFLKENKCRVLFASENARIYLKDLIVKYSEKNTPDNFPEFVVLLDQKGEYQTQKLISYQSFQKLSKYTSNAELSKLLVIA